MPSQRKRDSTLEELLCQATHFQQQRDETRQKALFNCKTSCEMWNRLTTQYLQRAADNKHLLHREFINLRYTINSKSSVTTGQPLRSLRSLTNHTLYIVVMWTEMTL